MTRARALLIAPILPSRTGNGLAMRVMLFVEAIETFADLDIVVVPVAGHPIASPSAFRASTSVSIVEPSLDRGFALIGRIPSAADRLSAFAHCGRPSLCGSLSPQTLDAVAGATAGRAYDLIHVARSYMMPVTGVLDPEVPLSLDLDEDDRLSVLSLSRNARRKGDGPRADWLAAEAEAFDRLIARTRHRTLATFVSNEADRASLIARHPGLDPRTVVNAVEIPPVVAHDDDGANDRFRRDARVRAECRRADLVRDPRAAAPARAHHAADQRPDRWGRSAPLHPGAGRRPEHQHPRRCRECRRGLSPRHHRHRAHAHGRGPSDQDRRGGGARHRLRGPSILGPRLARRHRLGRGVGDRIRCRLRGRPRQQEPSRPLRGSGRAPCTDPLRPRSRHRTVGPPPWPR